MGSTLTGGLDSSSIVCTARDLLRESTGQPLYTFSAFFPGLPEKQLVHIDERNFIGNVVDMGGVAPEAQIRRLVGMLARKGYPAGLAISVVKQALAERADELSGYAELLDPDAAPDLVGDIDAEPSPDG